MIAVSEARIISELFYRLDKIVRNDLSNNAVADERDCVSRLVSHFNYPFGLLNQYSFDRFKFKSKWFSRVNSGGHEQRFGCDSMIVFKIGDQLKVGLFEAKWPRVIKDPEYNWDYPQKSTKISHFTSQIERQAQWEGQAAIWEMFFYEGKVGRVNLPFDNEASTCILHGFAKSLVDSTASLQVAWNNNDLDILIRSAQTPAFNGSDQTNIKCIIFDILTCKLGLPIDVQPLDREFILVSADGQSSARCPIISFADDNENSHIIDDFMSENGLSFFMQLNIDPADIRG